MLGRRETFLSLGALGFLTTEAQAGAAELKEAATKEGNVTWYVAQMDAAQAEAMGKAFTAEYPGITVSVIRSTGQVAYQRLLLDFKNKTPQCDVFSATDSSHMPILKEADRVSKYEVENFKDMLPQFAAASVPGYYYTTVASRYFMIYNNQKVAAADAPKAWTDLLNPKWKGRVAFGHPAFSGCTGALVVALRKLYGWEYFEKLAKNNPKIGRSAADPVTLIVASECLVGPASAGGAYPSIDRGNPLTIVHPSDGLSVCVAPSTIPANAPHPNAARLFMEWMLSASFSKRMVGDGSEPLRGDVPPRADEPLLSTQKIIPMTVAELRKQVPEVIELWRDTFGT